MDKPVLILITTLNVSKLTKWVLKEPKFLVYFYHRHHFDSAVPVRGHPSPVMNKHFPPERFQLSAAVHQQLPTSLPTSSKTRTGIKIRQFKCRKSFYIKHFLSSPSKWLRFTHLHIRTKSTMLCNSVATILQKYSGPISHGTLQELQHSPHKWPVTRKMSPFDDVIMDYHLTQQLMACGPYLQQHIVFIVETTTFGNNAGLKAEGNNLHRNVHVAVYLLYPNWLRGPLLLKSQHG